MRLTRKKVIELCIEAWTIHAETGCTKFELPEKHRRIDNNCWFCEYGRQRDRINKNAKSTCDYCPLVISGIASESSGCYSTYYSQWEDAETSRTRKKYAKLFLAQIKSLRT